MFSNDLKTAIGSRRPVQIQEPGARHAAVAVVVTLDADPAMLFIKREERDADPWSGHAAFPGGFRADDAEAAETTAAREAEEETGLVLTRQELVGRLDDVYPRSAVLPKVVVTPCVFLIDAPRPVRPVGEIVQATWIPVREIFDLGNRKPYTLTLPTGNRDFDSIHVGGLIIWGLTERILQQISVLLRIRTA